MKKLAAISLVLAMTAASLAGCGSTADTAAPAESEAGRNHCSNNRGDNRYSSGYGSSRWQGI